MTKTIIKAKRYHDFSYGHTVHEHESKCHNLHGHNGRVYFTITAPSLDRLGRVMDFSVIKTKLCNWLEENWDHKFLVYENDERAQQLKDTNTTGVVILPFNPTAENMAEHLLNVVGPEQLAGTGCTLTEVEFYETRKCSAVVSL